MSAMTYRRKPRADTRAVPRALPADVRLAQSLARLFGVAGVLLLLGAAVAWAIGRPVFSLRGIEVGGELVRSSPQQLRSVAVPQLAGNFFTLDLRAAQAAFETVPWIRAAQAQRVWPNRLHVQVEEHRPAALWATERGARIVNTLGEVFEANLGAIEDEALPTLSGPDGSSDRVLALYRGLVPVLAPLQHGIETLALSARGSWTVTLDNGVTLELGRGEADEVLERTRRFVTTLPDLVMRFGRPLAHADLRHRDGYALRLTGLTTDAGKAAPPAAAPARPSQR
jgi:cell division protein FtsQ